MISQGNFVEVSELPLSYVMYELTPRHLDLIKQPECYYCGSVFYKTQPDACPGCGARDWRRKRK